MWTDGTLLRGVGCEFSVVWVNELFRAASVSPLCRVTGSRRGRTDPRPPACWWWTTWCTWPIWETAGYAGTTVTRWVCWMWLVSHGDCSSAVHLSVCLSVCLQAVLCRMEVSGGAGGQRRSVTLALSREHNPTIYEERMRIQRAGGTVRYTSTHLCCRVQA